MALHDLVGGKKWTFTQLAAEIERATAPAAPLIFPQGISPDFIRSVLIGWRFGKIICPVETDQTPAAFPKLPAHWVHLKSTSSTGGPPKLVAFTAEQMAADADHIVSGMALSRDAVNLGVISLAHSYGFSNLVLPLLLHGIPLALAESALPEMMRRAAKEFSSVTLAAVPALWRVWLEGKSIPQNVRLAISAGAPLPLPLEQEVFQQCGLKIHNFFGASECGGIAFDAAPKPRRDSRFLGTPLKNVWVSLNENGCLTVKSPAVGETYWPERSEKLAGGKFVTGDLVELRQEKIFLIGRDSDQINVAGRKISPEMVETILLTHPEVADALVFGVPSEDAERGETIVGCVVINGRLSPENLRQFLLTKLPAWKVPREWWFVDSLPANQRGKRSRNVCREQYLKNKSAADTRFWTR
ncbi:MAG: class I adenylate-forming enzyme family protein [Verrucomicrobiota bacterium]